MYSGTWELGTPKGLSKTVLNSEVVLFARSISMYWIDLGTEVVVLNSQVVPISQVIVKTGFTVPGFTSSWEIFNLSAATIVLTSISNISILMSASKNMNIITCIYNITSELIIESITV